MKTQSTLTTPAPRSAAVAPQAPSTGSNQAAQDRAGIAPSPTPAPTSGLLATLESMGANAVVALDALPVDTALEYASSLLHVPEIAAWAEQAQESSSAQGSLLGLFGCDDGPTDSGEALLVQLAKNFDKAVSRLKDASTLARAASLGAYANQIDASVKTLGPAKELASDIKGVAKWKDRIELVERLVDTSVAVYAVDMSDPKAAAVFDAWFAAVGGVGEELLAGTAWGAILRPFATMLKMLGESSFFQRVGYGRKPQGSDDMWRQVEV